MPAINSPVSMQSELARCCARNLAALGVHQPDVAAHLERCVIPENTTPTLGRDGLPAFRVAGSDGKTTWFGGSSMPSISAPEILAEIPAAGGNVILPAMMTGHEAKVLLSRIPTCHAVFAIEHDVTNLFLALHLHDFADAIQAGRLVLIPFANFKEAMTALFNRYPGYQLPTRLVTSPLLRQDAVTSIQSAVSEIAESIFAIQRKCLDDACAKWMSSSPPSSPKNLRWALIDAGNGATSPDRMRDLAAASRNIGQPHLVITNSEPRNGHIASAMRQLASPPADAVLFINGNSGLFSNLIPDRIPVASWFLPEAPLMPDSNGNTIRPQLVFASSVNQRDALLTAGVPADRLHLCPDGLRCEIEQADEESEDLPDLPRCLIVAPDIDDRPTSLNVTLPSHIRLWNRLQDMVEDTLAELDVVRAAALVRKAMHDVGMSGDDDKVIGFFTQVLRERIDPARRTCRALDALRAFEPATRVVTPQLFQRQTRCRTGPQAHGLSNAPSASLPLFVVVFPNAFAALTTCILESLAAECIVIVCGSSETWTKQYPGLADLAPAITFYQQASQLPKAIRTAQQQSTIDRAHTAHRVRTAHTLPHRLAFIFSFLKQLEHSPVPA